MMENNKLCIGYERVSTNEQKKKGFSIFEQKDTIEHMALRDGNVIFQHFVDEGYSGSNLKRPSMQEMLRFIVKEKVDLLYIWTPSRLSRNSTLSNSLKFLFDKNNVKVICESGTWLSGEEIKMDPDKAFQESVQNLVDQLEIQRVGSRTIKGMIGSAKNGNYPFGGRRLPIGYRKFKSNRGNSYKLEIDEDFVPLILYIFREVHDNKRSILSLTTELRAKREKGIKWDEYKVRSILTDPIYCGWFHRKWYSQKNHSPAFVDYDYWEEVQEVLSHRRIEKRYGYIFKGLIKCAKCGSICCCVSTVKHIKRKRKVVKQEYLYYICLNCNKRINEKRLVDEMLIHLDFHFNDDELMEQVKNTKMMLNRVKNRERILNDEYDEGYIENDKYEKEHKELLQKIKKLKKDLDHKLEPRRVYFKSLSFYEKRKLVLGTVYMIEVDLFMKKISKIYKSEKK